MARQGSGEGHPKHGMERFVAASKRAARSAWQHKEIIVGLSVTAVKFASGVSVGENPNQHSATSGFRGDPISSLKADHSGTQYGAGPPPKGKDPSTQVSGTNIIKADTSPVIPGKNISDRITNGDNSPKVVFAAGNHGNKTGPDSALIAQKRAQPTESGHWGNPEVTGKGKKSGDDQSFQNHPPNGDPPSDSDWDKAVQQGTDIAIGVINTVLNFGTLTGCGITPEAKAQIGIPTPTISPITPPEEAQSAQAMVIKSTGNNVDFRSLTPREKLFSQHVSAVTNILRATVGDKNVVNYTLQVPMSEQVFRNWERTGGAPAHLLVDNATGEKSVAVANAYYRDSYLQRVPITTEIGIHSEGTTLAVLSANGDKNEYTGKPWGRRDFVQPIGMFVDTSEFPLSDLNLSSQIGAIKDILYAFSKDSESFDPESYRILVPHFDKSGNLIPTVVEYGKNGRRIWQPGRDNKFRSPNEDELILEKKSVKDDHGIIRIKIAGSGANAGEEYDFGVFSANPDAAAVASVTPSVTPTRTPPTVTPRPTEVPATPTPTRELIPIPFKNRENPKFRTNVDYENGFGSPFTDPSYTTKSNPPNIIVDIVDDPEEGKVYRGVLDFQRVERTSDGHHRLYPSVWIPFQEASKGGGIYNDFDIKVDSTFAPVTKGELFSLATIFDVTANARAGTSSHVSYTLDLVWNNGNYYLYPHFPGYNGAQRRRGEIDKNAVSFSFDKWTKVVATLEENRIVKVFQDGNLISTGTINPETKFGASGAHWGLYSSDSIYKLKVYNGKTEFRVY